MKAWLFCLGIGLSICLVASCGPDTGPRKETFPVTGQVFVDGTPAATVRVMLTDLKGVDQDLPTSSMAYTDENGRFALSTYELSDGVPEGEYAVTFLWGKLDMLTMQYGGPDRLNGKYSDPDATPIRITVEKGKPAAMGKIELATD